MEIVIVALILFSLFLAICFAVVKGKAQLVEKHRRLLIESLWFRRNALPLLMESMDGVIGLEFDRQGIIDLRAKLSTGAYTLRELVTMEKQLSDNLDVAVRHADLSKELSVDTQYLVAREDVRNALVQAHRRHEEYNYEVQNWTKAMKQPWLRFWGFAFEVRKFKVLEGLE